MWLARTAPGLILAESKTSPLRINSALLSTQKSPTLGLVGATD